jgi:hypothetical protein
VGPDVVNGEDVGVVQGRDGPGLTLEAAQALGVTGDLLGEHLEGDLAVEAGVAGAVHLTHAPGPEGRQDLVSSEQGSR